MAESDRALLILDLSTDTSGVPPPGAANIVRFVQGELRYFRERGRPVFFAVTRLASDRSDPVPTMVQELTPRTDEQVLVKRTPSAFFQTSLREQLERLRVKRLTIAGLETHTAVLLTAADALASGFEVVVPDPCVAATDVELHRVALRLIRDAWPRWLGRAPADEDPDETGRLRRAPPKAER